MQKITTVHYCIELTQLITTYNDVLKNRTCLSASLESTPPRVDRAVKLE